jgi:type II secretory pathway component PulF
VLTYHYKARDAAGKLVKGVMEASSKEELIDKLHNMGYMATRVDKVSDPVKLGSMFESFKRISPEEMIMFNIQLSNLIGAGISILSSLRALHQQIESPKLKGIIGSVSRNIEAGDSLSQAFARYPGVFSGLFINMVRAGEASGKLELVLTRFAEFFEYEVNLKQKIKGSLFYPVILLFAGLAVTLFIVTFVIPKFAEIFTRSGISLPLVTSVLYKVGLSIKHYWYFILLFFGAVLAGIKYVISGTARGRRGLDALKLKMFLVGSLFRKISISRFCHTLATLTASGVPILTSLDISRDVIGNEILAGVIEHVRRSVEKGQNMSEPLRVSGEFPPDVIQMVAAGEESGELPEMLQKAAQLYDRSIEYRVKKLTTLIEPLLLVLMGCMVGFIMASMLLPIFDMVKVLRH